MDKKTHTITINLNDFEFSIIKTIAYMERRTISEVARLILNDNALKLYYERYTHSEPAHFTPGVLPADFDNKK